MYYRDLEAFNICSTATDLCDFVQAKTIYTSTGLLYSTIEIPPTARDEIFEILSRNSLPRWTPKNEMGDFHYHPRNLGSGKYQLHIELSGNRASRTPSHYGLLSLERK
jgi:hypothetical protein